MKKIMAIGAHILDAEISCGMVLAKHALLGDEIVTVALTAGENGRPATFTREEFRELNKRGAENFAKELDGKFVCMDYADSMLPETEELYNRLAELIRKEKTDVVLTHWEGSSHDDHNVTAKAVRRAVRRARYADGEYPAHREIETYYAENWEDMDGFVPFLYVDVTEGYELWKKAIEHVYLATKATYFNYAAYYDCSVVVCNSLWRRE